MARGDQLGRQWKIIQTLIYSRRGKSAAELASDLDCHPRTVYRDLEALQIAGFPIYSPYLSPAHFIRLSPQRPQRTP
jgi:predicted DNA-binding transcriptional regulator YafY